MIRITTILLLTSTLFFSCRQEPKENAKHFQYPEYAKGFKIREVGGYKEIEVQQPFPDAKASFKYLLVPKDMDTPAHDADVEVIQIPIEKIICTSTSHIALLDLLGATHTLAGFPTTDLISSPTARVRIDSGLVADLGVDKEMNLELLFSLHPDMVMGYSITGDMLKLSKIKELGIPVVINGEYMEEHPLGRAEWIKFMAAFFGKEVLADSIFDNIKNEYESSKALIKNPVTRPTVMSGILYGDAWFLPGGKNYAARIFEDAGYRYLWEEDSNTGFLKLSFESVYATAKDADFWIGVGSFESRKEMEGAEKRYVLFESFKKSSIYTYDARKGAKGGSEYFESGYSRPDLILKDLIKISNPDLLPGYSLYFHKKLE